MSGWWSLPKAAPILVRHLSAYAELAEQDLAVAQSQFARRLVALGVVFAAAVFTIAMVCLAVVAATWNTPNRMLAVYILLGFFAVTLGIALSQLTAVSARADALFSSVRREWALDRVLLDRMLAQTDDDERPAAARGAGANGHANADEPANGERRG